MPTQEFNAEVGHVVQAETYNHIHQNDLGPLLTPRERVELNNKIQALHNRFGEHGAKTWRWLHDLFRVKNSKEVRVGQLKLIETILDLKYEQLEHHAQLVPQNGDELRLSALTEELIGKNLDIEQYQARQHELLAHNTQLAEQLRRAENGVNSLLNQATQDQQRAKRTRTTLALTITLLLASTASTAYFFTESQAIQAQLIAAEARLNHCEFNGQSYSLGAILKRDSPPHLQCIQDDNSVVWQPLKSTPKRR